MAEIVVDDEYWMRTTGMTVEALDLACQALRAAPSEGEPIFIRPDATDVVAWTCHDTQTVPREYAPYDALTDPNQWMIVNPSTTQVIAFSESQDPTTWTTSASSLDYGAWWSGEGNAPRGQPMFRIHEDDEDEGFPSPFRTDGRVNHWYLKWVDRIEGRG